MEEIKQKANTFMIKESNAHEDNWKGYTTEEWMSLFAQELVEEEIARLEGRLEQIKKHVLKIETKWVPLKLQIATSRPHLRQDANEVSLEFLELMKTLGLVGLEEGDKKQ